MAVEVVTFPLCVLRTNSDFCLVHYIKSLVFYNRRAECLQRGTNWVFI